MEPGLEGNRPGRLNSPTILGHTRGRRAVAAGAMAGGASVGRPGLLVVVFRNLLDNALKFTRAGDRVEVRVMEDGEWAVVEVADTGPGIPAEELPHIFEELYRGSNARGIPGSGLGLALVQRIVALHGGEVTVRSREGQGTVVRVRLPLAPET